MPLPLVTRVPSTAHSLFALDEEVPLGSHCDKDRGPEKVGEYVLTEHIGAGSSGSNVFAATRVDGASSSESVAIKILSATGPTASCTLPRFHREATLTCELRGHPHLVSGIEHGESAGYHYLAMEMLRGQTLDELLGSQGRLDWREATVVALHIARALAHLDANGIVHRDVKPENIMVSGAADAGRSWTSAGPVATLIDLGLARRAATDADAMCLGDDDADDDANGSNPAGARPSPAASPAVMRRVMTPAYSAIGSPAFMAPEQARDARLAQSASDVYGLGTTYYAAVTGTLPFSGSSPMRVLQQVLNGDVVPPSRHVPALPRAVDALIMWLLQTAPRDRPPSGAALIAIVEQVLRAPHDATPVARAREELARLRALEDAAAWRQRALACAVAVALLAWLVWEAVHLKPG